MRRNNDNNHLFKYQTNIEIRRQIDKCLHAINAKHAQMVGIDMKKEDYLLYLQEIQPFKDIIKLLDEDYYNTLFL